MFHTHLWGVSVAEAFVLLFEDWGGFALMMWHNNCWFGEGKIYVVSYPQ